MICSSRVMPRSPCARRGSGRAQGAQYIGPPFQVVVISI
ncbi:hypothetical protein MXAN_2493 [Myxococcus xanthus DK 1622]|uniref:Uncharacterized protein n=1 Tax=Myxococcus xanthus (strain DK1622) TaxID=246197 RepID=Q1D9G1_MYXXD|nr:hypothetical protein MXAN_2493 [Myxococcus xanthus DK 1622]